MWSSREDREELGPKGDFSTINVNALTSISDVGQTVARKIVNINTASEKSKRHVRSEYRTQRQLDHPNIAEYVDVEWGDGQVKFYMHHFPNGSLDTMINKRSNGIPIDDVWAIAYQLSSAVAYCHDPTKNIKVTADDGSSEQSLHSKIVYHRDIKPQNSS